MRDLFPKRPSSRHLVSHPLWEVKRLHSSSDDDNNNKQTRVRWFNLKLKVQQLSLGLSPRNRQISGFFKCNLKGEKGA